MTDNPRAGILGRRQWAIWYLVLFSLFLFSAFIWPTRAAAACTVPNTITNGQPADATVVMGNFNALKDCVDTKIAPTGTPVAGNLSTFSSPNTLTSGDLSGDCATAGNLSVTCTKTNGTAFGYFATGTDAGQLTGNISVNRFNNGINADTTRFLRGDGTWATPPTGDGGGGGGSPIITFNVGGVNTSTHSTKGNRFKLGRSATASELIFVASPDTITQKFEIRLFQLATNGTTISSLIASSSEITVNATGNQSLSYTLPNPVTLFSDTWYALVLVRIDGGSCRTTEGQRANSGALFVDSGNIFVGTNNPTVGTVFTVGALSVGAYIIQ